MSLGPRLLEVLENELIPATRAAVEAGNKIFGAALLRKSDLSTVLVGTNNETENPMWHGEVHTIKLYHEMPDRPDPGELIFFSTHEPCTMCLSAITWAGFDNFTYLFSHEDSRDAFAIPHDLKILKEVFGLEPGGYRASNAFWKSQRLGDLLEGPGQQARLEAVRRAYDELSGLYQGGKGANDTPLN